MNVRLRTGLMLWLPGVLVLLGGMPVLLRTGQVDPLGWGKPALILIAAAAFLMKCRGMFPAIWAGAGVVGTVLLFAALATGRAPDPGSTAWMFAAASLACAGGILLVLRPWLGAATCGLALLCGWLSSPPTIRQAPLPRPTLAVISALPLFWRDGQSGVEARADAPIIGLLRQRFDVRPLDSPLASSLSGMDRLLLAQPRAMSSAELTALDEWVRDGGRLLLLSDPLLRWPSPLPLSDRRRPPSVSLLAPLLAHWGVRLLPPTSAGEVRHALQDGRLLTTVAAGSFQLQPGYDCRVEAAGLLARCAVGRGRVLLLADADLIDDRLWLADPAAPIDPRKWTADTPAFVAKALGAGEMGRDRQWVKSAPDLISALRSAILFGIFWASLGSWVLHAANRVTPAAHPGRKTVRKGLKSG